MTDLKKLWRFENGVDRDSRWSARWHLFSLRGRFDEGGNRRGEAVKVEKGSGEAVQLAKKRTPKLAPIASHPVPLIVKERPAWPAQLEHEAERARILDKNAVYLRAKDVAARYGLSVQWVQRCKALQKYKRKAGKYIVYRLEDLLEFEELKVGSGRGYPLDVIGPSVEKPEPGGPIKSLKLDIL